MKKLSINESVKIESQVAFNPDEMNKLFNLSSKVKFFSFKKFLKSALSKEESTKIFNQFEKTLYKKMEVIVDSFSKKYWLDNLALSDADEEKEGNRDVYIIHTLVEGQYKNEDEDSMIMSDRLESLVPVIKPKMESLNIKDSIDIKVYFDEDSGEYVSFDVYLYFPAAYNTPYFKPISSDYQPPDLKGKIVVLTGKPPAGFTKQKVAEILKSKFKVASVEPSFTKKTQVVIYNSTQDTSKAKKAKEAGLIIIPYEEIV